MKSKYIIKGLLKSIPGIEYIFEFNKRTGGSCSARYCYSVWLRHLIYAYKNGYNSVPKIVAELGPGDTLGTGFAALISGAEKYIALDIKKYSDVNENLKIFDELVSLFKNKTDLPNEDEFKEIRPLLDNYDFPSYIFNSNQLNTLLNENRISSIKNAIIEIHSSIENKFIEYKVPWNNHIDLKNESVDMLFSQAVLQDVNNLEDTYKKISLLLKPNGIQSHDIGFKSCKTADTWFGHWEYSELEWKIIKGRKKIFINREPYSTHFKFLNSNQSKIIFEQRRIAETKINRNNLANRFTSLTDSDLTTYSVFIQAKKITD